VQQVQATLRCAGFAAPAPLAGPFALGAGTVVVESLEDRGEIADARDAATRRLLACGLAELVATARRFVDLAGLRERRPGRPRLHHELGELQAPAAADARRGTRISR